MRQLQKDFNNEVRITGSNPMVIYVNTFLTRYRFEAVSKGYHAIIGEEDIRPITVSSDVYAGI